MLRNIASLIDIKLDLIHINSIAIIILYAIQSAYTGMRRLDADHMYER